MVQLQPSQVTALILPVTLLSLSLWGIYPSKNEMSRFQTHSLLWSSQSMLHTRYQDPMYNEEINVLHRVAQLSSRVKVSIWIYPIFNSIWISLHSFAMPQAHGQRLLLSRINYQNENNNKNAIWKTFIEFLFCGRYCSKPSRNSYKHYEAGIGIISILQRWKVREKERLNNLPKVIGLESRRARIHLRWSGSRNQPDLGDMIHLR